MRPWITHLTSNSSAYNDFHSFVVGAMETLNRELATAVRADEMEKARGIAHEIKVYETLRKSVNREVREHNSQVTYLNEVKGG